MTTEDIDGPPTDPEAPTDRSLDAVAQGKRPADLILRGGRVLHPDGKFREGTVAVTGEWIAAVVNDSERVSGPETVTIDVAGHTVIPGLIDAHDHVDVNATIERRYHRRLARGTTSVITEASAIASTAGLNGVEELLAATAGLPLSVFVTVPPQGFVDTFEPVATTRGDLDRAADLLHHDRVVGVGETNWIHVVGRAAADLRALCERARAAGCRIVGHGAGCRDETLSAFATVVGNDHEPTSTGDVSARLARGIHVVGRRGSVRDDLDAIVETNRPRGDVSLCTDGTWPQDDAGMDDVLRAAIDRGIHPIEAVEMATRAPATHFRLWDRGRIAPGYRADLVVLSDLAEVQIETVVAGGKVVVRAGDPVVGPRSHDYPDRIRDAVQVTLSPDALRVSTDAGADGRVRAIRAGDGLVTHPTTVEPPVSAGTFVADPGSDLLKAALFDRRPGGSRHFVGFVMGLGIERGAVATTLTWEQPAVVAVGATDAAMTTAIDRVTAIGGGWVVVDDAHDGDGSSPVATATLSMPVGGVMADRVPDRVAAGYHDVSAAIEAIGGGADPDFPRGNAGPPGALLALQTLAFPGVPVLKLSLSGYAHVIQRVLVGLDPAVGPGTE